MTNKFDLAGIRNYFSNVPVHFHCEESAQWLESGKLSVNMSTIYTELIRQAARCNRFSSDIVYDIESINNAFEDWTGEKNLFAIGFRRDGTDGNSFVLSRVNGECSSIYGIHKLYFALYFVEVLEDEYEGFKKIVCNGYYL